MASPGYIRFRIPKGKDLLVYAPNGKAMRSAGPGVYRGSIKEISGREWVLIAGVLHGFGLPLDDDGSDTYEFDVPLAQSYGIITELEIASEPFTEEAS